MKEAVNPLTFLGLTGAFVVLAFQAGSVEQFVSLFIIVFAVAVAARVSVRSVLLRLGPFLMFLPAMFFFYIIMSLILTGGALISVFRSAAVSAARILLMMSGMALFLELTSLMKMLDALRTLWRGLRIRLRFVEDSFQLLYLTFRFFPILREEVIAMTRYHMTLGLPPVKGMTNRIRLTATYLPGLIANCLHRAENLGLAMQTRRYGHVLPRGIAKPVRFSLADVVVFLAFIAVVTGYSKLA